MAKKGRRAQTRRVSQVARKTFRKRSSRRGAENNTTLMIASGVYGAVRGRISNALQPFTRNVPLGSIGDEAVILGAGWLLSKRVKNSNVKEFLKASMIVESARIGEAIADGSAFAITKSGSSGTSGFPV